MITYTKLGLNGRLGNQMFQYAATMAAAENAAAVFAIPIENQELSKYFNLSCKFFSIQDNRQILSRLNIYQESSFNYNQNFSFIGDNTDLLGYFQTEKYFKKIEDKIRKEFSFKKEILDKCNEKIINLKNQYNKKICSLHVRRGDYVNLQNYHSLCSLEYYKKAIDINSDCIFYVFSDDIQWCKQNFIEKKFIFSEQNSQEQDLCLMSLCDNNIIANSSFSWWGAWLNLNKEKQIIAPNNWFGPSYKGHDTTDLYCEDWIKI